MLLVPYPYVCLSHSTSRGLNKVTDLHGITIITIISKYQLQSEETFSVLCATLIYIKLLNILYIIYTVMQNATRPLVFDLNDILRAQLSSLRTAVFPNLYSQMFVLHQVWCFQSKFLKALPIFILRIHIENLYLLMLFWIWIDSE
jgi:hypothetical protein